MHHKKMIVKNHWKSIDDIHWMNKQKINLEKAVRKEQKTE